MAKRIARADYVAVFHGLDELALGRNLVAARSATSLKVKRKGKGFHRGEPCLDPATIVSGNEVAFVQTTTGIGDGAHLRFSIPVAAEGSLRRRARSCRRCAVLRRSWEMDVRWRDERTITAHQEICDLQRCKILHLVVEAYAVLFAERNA